MASGAGGLLHDVLPHGEPADEDEDDNGRSFEAFERQYATDHSWESLQEDEQGFLRPLDATAELRARRQRAMSAAQSARIRKGMIRYVLLVLDLSHAASASDLRPSRLSVMVGACRAFIRRFFELNPLSQLGLCVLRNGIAEKLTELSGSPEAQVAKLQQYGMDAGGDASLQNGLELSLELMSGVPPYGSREVLLLMAALSIVDPGRVEDSIQACKAANIRISIVGVAAEVHILHRATQVTNGTYGVALNESHLSELLLAHAPPPPAPLDSSRQSLCAWGSLSGPLVNRVLRCMLGSCPRWWRGGYTCPRCRARTAELPTRCHVCGLMLISSPHLARSYHHLFPVPPFEEVSPQGLAAATAEAAAAAPGSSSINWYEPGGASSSAQEQQHQASSSKPQPLAAGGSSSAARGSLYCYGCLKQLVSGQGPGGTPAAHQANLVLKCGQCRQLFCFECDAFVHEMLHNCPGCECAAAVPAATGPPSSSAPTSSANGVIH